MQVQLGCLLRKAESFDTAREQFGWIPRMCRLYTGSLMSESICERVHSTGSDIMDEGNTSLKDQTFERIAVLRMNRDTKEKWREKHNFWLNDTVFAKLIFFHVE